MSTEKKLMFENGLVIHIHHGAIGDRRYQFAVKPTYIVAYSQKKNEAMKCIGFWQPKQLTP